MRPKSLNVLRVIVDSKCKQKGKPMSYLIF